MTPICGFVLCLSLSACRGPADSRVLEGAKNRASKLPTLLLEHTTTHNELGLKYIHMKELQAYSEPLFQVMLVLPLSQIYVLEGALSICTWSTARMLEWQWGDMLPHQCHPMG